MPTFLADPTPGFYVVLFLVTAVAVFIAAKYQDRGSLIRAAAAVVLLFALYLCDQFNESPREETLRKVEELAQAVNERSEAKFASHVSESFSADKLKKADVSKIVGLARQHNVTAAVWGFNRDEFKTITDREVEFTFDAKATGPNGEPFLRHFKVTFVKDPDNQWRLKSFTPYDYAKKTNGSPDPIPGL